MVEKGQFQGETYIIRRHGKAVAAVVPLQVYENWKRQRQALFGLIREMQEETDLDPEVADQLAAEALTVIRSEST